MSHVHVARDYGIDQVSVKLLHYACSTSVLDTNLIP